MSRTGWAFRYRVLTEGASIEAANGERGYVALSVSERVISNPDLYLIVCARRQMQKLVRQLRRAGA
jgi:hypothetical protein